ncbi:MAG: translation initiation factor IF-2 [Candidatus Aenigmatarchaeota archaeon]|nr:MAG: translation initiation factor IF-2 [Candidatus Aenigmarchaeota archaeon]RLJ08789.1 MAG: translation initiation factor IF-2 [Candidatus Aenigmarchaeota archaeon]
MTVRSPILVLLGHVDHGKTTLIDKIRGTAVVKAEPGAITQHISASYVPVDVIKKYCGDMLRKMNIELNIPGLLWIDSPGHEAFTTLRKRGGAIADLAVLVIDINEGFQPQTDESLNFLKQFKTPFVVALTKIDRILGWLPLENACFLDSFKQQQERTQNELEEKVYKIVAQFSDRGFSSERFDRVQDFEKQICLVPVSGVTGEGVPDLLMVISGIAQKYLKNRLEITPGEGKGTVLEVKEFKGMGITIDVVLYDGEMKKGDYIVIGSSKGVITTRIRAIMVPEPLKDTRTEKRFKNIEYVSAAASVKISAPGLETIVAGSPLRVVRDEKDVEKAKKDIESEIEEVEITTEKEGAILRADTLGSLEALVKTLKHESLPIRKALVGDVSKSDILELKTMKEPVIFAFCVSCPEDVKKLAKSNNVKIFRSDVIYRLIEEYKEWLQDKKKREEERILETVTRPGRIKVLPGYVFRQCKPAVFGVEILKGIIRQGYKLTLNENIMGEIREIQSQGETVKEAKRGEKVAVSMDGVTVGKDFKEGDILDVYIPEEDLEKLKKVKSKLDESEIEILKEKYGW